VIVADDEFDCYYVIKILEEADEKYFFSTRTFVRSVDMAKKFNTLISARRSIKLLENKVCKIEKFKRNNF